MQEEFHGEVINGTKVYQRLYGWKSLNVNVWLPSVSELVGIAGNQNTNTGVYLSAMQGLNTSNAHYVDSKGGNQFTYFVPYNASGGGEKLWSACKQEMTWLRSTDLGNYATAWRTTKRHVRFTCSVVNAFATVHSHYHLFVVEGHTGNKLILPFYLSSLVFSLISSIPSHKKKNKDYEKLGTKAVQEEFHGIDHGGGTYTYKQLYNWNSVNANIWLPSLSELVGIDPNKYYDASGVYWSAMQGINSSQKWHVDTQGGNQFAYFKQYNATGGGEAVMNACNQQNAWLRSTSYWSEDNVWKTADAVTFNAYYPTTSLAVHPAGCGTRPFYSAHRKTAPA